MTALHAAALATVFYAGCAGAVSGTADAGCGDQRMMDAARQVLAPPVLDRAYVLRSMISGMSAVPSADAGTASARTADLKRLDSLWILAGEACEGDVVEALFALSVATLPYHSFPAVIPLIGVSVSIPVSTESICMFQRRLRALPRRLFGDSPSSGDADKLPHFFGSAWLRIVTTDRAVTARIGELIETGESVFKLQGSRDPRDLRVNALGIRFAERLQRDRTSRPSSLFRNPPPEDTRP